MYQIRRTDTPPDAGPLHAALLRAMSDESWMRRYERWLESRSRSCSQASRPSRSRPSR